MSFTPMIKQYLEIKAQYPDAILFFRLGDFYEMFFEDARVSSKVLEITLTGRDGGGQERVPMCGVPYHAADGYIAKLIGKGFKVAICEQVENPAAAKGIVHREVIRVITPGTLMEDYLLEDKKNNYLASIAPVNSDFGLAVTDITTGSFMVSTFSGEKAIFSLREELGRLVPAEVIFPLSKAAELEQEVKLAGTAALSGYRDAAFSINEAGRVLENKFGKDFFKVKFSISAICASGALLSFLLETQKRELYHINKIHFYRPGRFMLLDSATRRNLELTRSLIEGNRKNTLISVLDHIVTAMGGRLLKNWIEQPLLEKDKIELRLDAVEVLVKNIFLRQDINSILKSIYDIERLAGKISYGTANARDLVALRKSLGQLPLLKNVLNEAGSLLLADISNIIDPMDDIRELLDKAFVADPPFSLRDGGIIKQGYNPEVDRLRSIGKEGKNLIASMEEKERTRTGIKSLKVGFNKVFGYYIEITKSNLSMVPPYFRRKQTLANAERYITQELKEYEDAILGAEERLANLEYSLFNEIRDLLSKNIRRIQKSAGAVAKADVIQSLAEAAYQGRYTKPEIVEQGIINIKDGRHPVLEQVMGTGKFVPNDTYMDNEKNRMILLTGPNMAGKSTFMRQVALIVIMSQIGSFVPAASANISIIDSIFTRVGAADDLAGGRSTFMVEMNECSTIVMGATPKSLVIMDEVGRGTSTYDGISIARALAEYIHLKIKPKVLFSTHYHELTDLDRIDGIVNFNVAVEEEGENITFLRKVVPGKADRSYGIHVAKLAGLPGEIITRSNEILKSFEQTAETSDCIAATDNLFDSRANLSEHPVLQELSRLNILELTPIDAMNKLFQLQKSLNEDI